MPRLTSPREFFSAISESLRLKFSLAWLTFLGLAVPAAALMSVGLPERYVLPALLFLVVPFQYAIFCLLQKRHEPKAKEESRSPEMFQSATAADLNVFEFQLGPRVTVATGLSLAVMCFVLGREAPISASTAPSNQERPAAATSVNIIPIK